MATARRIVIIGPTDVEAEIDTLLDVLDLASGLLGKDSMNTWFWRTDGSPGIHISGPQGLADEQMNISDADLVVGVFWSRLGTPTMGDESGTAHELKLAVESWRERRRPEIFLYFCERDPPMSILLDNERRKQLDALIRFRLSLPNEIGHWTYSSTDRLRADFNSHLGKWLGSNHMLPIGDDSNDQVEETLLTLPDASRSLPRKSSTVALKAALSRAPIVCLNGISGSGKTLLAAQYLTSAELLSDHQGGALWYDMPSNGTLEEMLGALRDAAGPQDWSTTSRVKTLLTNLRLRRKLLVIDDLHQAEPHSFDALIGMAVRQTTPACILLLSRRAVENIDVENITIRPWNIQEIHSLLRHLGVRTLQEELYERLKLSTGGLPLAVKLFATLIKLGNDPERLLDGELAQSDRTERWYAEIQDSLAPSELTLLRYFALADPYVTEPVLRQAKGRLEKSERSRAFFRLQTLLLIEPRGKARWVMHPFVAEHTLNATPDNVLRDVLKDLSHFSWSGIQRIKHAQIGDPTLVAGIRACQYAQRAGEYGRASKIIKRISSRAKRLGYYRKLKSLCQTQIAGERDVDPWIVYHLAHCEFVLGDAESATGLLGALMSNVRDSALFYASARLLAEARSQLGQRDEAIAELRKSLSGAPTLNHNSTSLYNYARATLAQLLIENGLLDEASQIVGDLARTEKEDRTLGVISVLLGLIDLRQNARHAVQRFRIAESKFRSVGDRRGLGWALRGLSEALLEFSDVTQRLPRAVIRDAITTTARIGQATDEYAQWLERILPKIADDPAILSLVEHERARVGVDLEILTPNLTGRVQAPEGSAETAPVEEDSGE